MGRSSKGGSGGSSTTTQTTAPWEGQQPYLNQIFSESQNLYNSGGMAPAYYQGNTVAGRDPYTQQAIEAQAQRALGGSAVTQGAQNMATGTLSGDYLNNNPFTAGQSNPYLDAMVNRATGQALANTNSNFAQAGRYGSGAHAAAANDAAGNIATQMYGQAYDSDMNRALSAYNAERNNMMQAAGLANNLANQDYADLAALSEAGTANENYNQQVLNADIDRYNYNAALPLTALQNYMGLVQGNYGGSGTTTATGQAGRGNALGNILGGTAAGAGIGNLFGGAGYGAAAGGILGLLGSYF